MNRRNWISRDSSGFHWRRKQKRRQTAVLCLLFLGSLLVGWFSFDPIYMMVTGSALPNQIPVEEPSQPEPEAPLDELPEMEFPAGDIEEDLVPETMQFPARSIYLPLELMRTPVQLVQTLQGWKASGGEGIVFDLKNAAGRVLYDSALPICTENMSLADTVYSLESLCQTIRDAGLVPVGRLFAFRDSTSTKTMSAGAVKYMDSQINWIDNSLANGGKAWLNPCSEQARNYILSLVEEAASRGVAYLILDGVQFPEGYSLHLATYGVASPNRSEVLSAFVKTASEEAAKWDCEVWPVLNLMTTTKASQIRCGAEPEKILAAAGHAVLDVGLTQFGTGVRTEQLTIQDPAGNPAQAVREALLSSQEVLAALDGAELAAMVPVSVQQTEQFAALSQAVSEQQIAKVFWIADNGQYPSELIS